MILFHGTNGEKTSQKILSEGVVAFNLSHIDGFDDYAPYRAFRERKEAHDIQFRLKNISPPHGA